MVDIFTYHPTSVVTAGQISKLMICLEIFFVLQMTPKMITIFIAFSRLSLVQLQMRRS